MFKSHDLADKYLFIKGEIRCLFVNSLEETQKLSSHDFIPLLTPHVGGKVCKKKTKTVGHYCVLQLVS